MACETTTTDGGICDTVGSTNGLVTVTLTPNGDGTCNVTAQWTGGVPGSGCADGSCSYYGTASLDHVPMDNSPHALVFTSFTYTAGGRAIYSQNWDGVTAPALPSDWVWSSPSQWATTASAPVGSISGGNAVGWLLPGSGNVGGWNTRDGADGNVCWSASVCSTDTFIGSADQPEVFLRVRCSSATSQSTEYQAQFVWFNGPFGGGSALYIHRWLSGTGSTLATLVGFPVSTSVWYNVAFTCVGSSLSVVVQRLSDGFYLNSSGAWQSGAATALSATDSNITGEGYVGLIATSDSSPSDVFIDDCKLLAVGSFTRSASVHTESFGGVTPPALPSDWTWDSSANWKTTASPPSGSISASNALTTAVIIGGAYAGWNTLDGHGGNVTVSASFSSQSITSGSGAFVQGWVLARWSSPGATSGFSAYTAKLVFYDGATAAPAVRLTKFISGSETVLGTLALSSGAIANNHWYNIALSCYGSTLFVVVKRLTDGNYLQPDGTWGSTLAQALSATDGSITGQGYAGIVLGDNGGGGAGDVYADDFSISTLPTMTIQVPAP